MIADKFPAMREIDGNFHPSDDCIKIIAEITYAWLERLLHPKTPDSTLREMILSLNGEDTTLFAGIKEGLKRKKVDLKIAKKMKLEFSNYEEDGTELRKVLFSHIGVILIYNNVVLLAFFLWHHV